MIAASLNLFGMRSLPPSHVLSRFVEDSDVIFFGDLTAQCRTKFLPQRIPGVVVLSHGVVKAVIARQDQMHFWWRRKESGCDSDRGLSLQNGKPCRIADCYPLLGTQAHT